MRKFEFSRDETLYLVDGSSFSYRAFFAIKGLATSKGFPTGAIFGFLNTLRKILREFNPLYLAVCFDVSRRTFRQEKFKEYKISRAPVPDSFKIQLPWIKELIKALSISIVEKEGFEADDLIATLAEKAKGRGFRCLVFSSDKDILQVVEDRLVMVYNLHKDILYDEDRVKESFGVAPQNIPDFLALCGDPIDDIPGVKGIGPKNAALLIRDYSTVENVLNNLDLLPRDSLKKLIAESKNSMALSKELAMLKRDVPLDLDLENFKIGEPDYNKLQSLCRELEFKSLIEEFSSKYPGGEEISWREFSPKLIPNLKKNEELIFYFNEGFFFIYGEGQIYRANLAEVKNLLEDPQLKKVSFDLKEVLLKLSPNVNFKPPYFDVMVAAHLLKCYLQDLSLESIVWEFLRKTYSQIGGAEKVKFIAQLYYLFKEKLKEEELESIFFDIEMPLLEVLVGMESSPINIDLDYLKDNFNFLKERQSILEDRIYSLAGVKFNLNSPKQLAQVLFERLSLKPNRRTKTGFSTDEDSLNKLRKEHPIVEDILKYRKLTKLLTTYIEPFIVYAEENAGKIYPRFSQVASSTGRLISSSPNLQSIPIKEEEGKKIRGAFVSCFKDGFILSADYSQIELRILAHLSQDDNLIEAFKKGRDIHRFTASLLFSKREEAVSYKEREFAKRINFGIVYGMSSYGLSNELEISLEEAESFIFEYFRRYPKVKEYIDRTVSQAQECGYVKTLFGRRRVLENINSPHKSLREYALRQAINAPIQGTAADIIKLAMIKIYKEFKQRGIKSRLLIQIHDELVFDIEPSELENVSFRIKEIMENVVTLSVPLEVNIYRGKSWLEATKI